jgi:purine-binding chemotaxis protein CheW
MEQKKHSEKQIVVFKLGNEEFGVDINEVKEIIKLDDITRVPNTESFIEGVINLRGKIIVIIDLAKKINLEINKRDKDTRIIVIETNGSTIGMIVDECNEVLRISGEQIEPAPDIIKKKISQEYIEGVGILKERLIILLDLIRVLGKDDMNKVDAVSGNAAEVA